MATTPAPSQGSQTDGRHLRRERSRRVVTSAVLDLVRETGCVPSVQEVATRAGVTPRTIFNLFDGATALLLAGVQAFRDEALSRLPAVPPIASLPERVDVYVRELAPFLDDYSRIRWVALTARVPIPDIKRGVVLEASYHRLVEVLGTAGERLERAPARRAALRAAIDPLTWRLYREHQGLSMEAACAALAHTVVSLTRHGSRAD